MSMLSKLGVTISNPAPITIEAQSYAEYIALLHVQVETLAKAGAVLAQENPGLLNERIAEVQATIASIEGSARIALLEHLRWAREQGLRFAITEPGAPLRH